jgi:AcrR family transcriptional regulator
VSMDDFAHECGVTKPVLYANFGDKAGLMQAVANQVADEIVVEVMAALTSPGTVRDIVASTIDTFVSFVEHDPNLYRYLLRIPTPISPEHPDLASLTRGIGQAIAAVLDGAMQEAGYDPGAAEPWAFAILGMVYVASDWWSQNSSVSRTRFVEYLTDLLLDGLVSTGIGELPEASFAFPGRLVNP